MSSIRSSSKPSLKIKLFGMDTKQLFEKYESEICEICIREGFCSVGPYSLCEGQGCESACRLFADENEIDMED